jgi:hypothetical protein
VTLYNSPEQIEAMLTALRELSLEIVGETEVVVDLTADAPGRRDHLSGRPGNT